MVSLWTDGGLISRRTYFEFERHSLSRNAVRLFRKFGCLLLMWPDDQALILDLLPSMHDPPRRAVRLWDAGRLVVATLGRQGVESYEGLDGLLALSLSFAISSLVTAPS